MLVGALLAEYLRTTHVTSAPPAHKYVTVRDKVACLYNLNLHNNVLFNFAFINLKINPRY